MRIGISTALGAAVADPAAGPAPGPAAEGPVLIVVAGQSNARVAGTSAAVPPASYTGGALGDVRSFVRAASGGWAESIAAGTFQPYDVTANADPDNSGTAWGTEAEIVRLMRQANDMRPVYVVKEAVNGQSLQSHWHPETQGERFAFLEAKVARARALVPGGFGEEIVLWNQGEADATDGASADAYAASFAAWFAALRARVSGTARVIVQRIRPMGYAPGNVVTDPDGWTRAASVREAQVAVPLADGNATTIDTDFDPTNFAELHPGQPWVEGMGARSFAAWRGTHDATYGAITDSVPDPLSFADQAGVPASTPVLSPSVPVLGIQRRTPVTVAGGEWRTLNALDGDAVIRDWTSSAGTVDKFQRLQLRTTSSADPLGAVTVDVTVGGVAAGWTVTTAAAGISHEPETDAFALQVQANGGASLAGAQKDALDAFYVAAKASTWWGRLDRLYLRLADEVSSSLDLVSRSVSLSKVSTSGALHSWSAAWGWTPNDTANAALDLKVAPVTDLSQDDASILVWYSALATNANGEVMSEVPTGNLFARFLTTGAGRVRLFTGANANFTGLTTAPGLRAVVRDGATSTRVHGPAGELIGTSANASALPAANGLYLGSVSGLMSDACFLGAGAGAALTPAELQDLAAAVDALHAAFAP